MRSALLVPVALLAACRAEPPPAPPATSPQGAPGAPAAVGAASLAPASAPLPAPGASSMPEVSGHPRLWLTAADLPRLRAWANPQNPVWERGLKQALAQAVQTYDKEFYPGGQPNPKWPDPGIDNWIGKCTEAYAEMFAFASLIDPDPAARRTHAERARNLLMVVVREAEKGVDPNRQNPAPYRGSAFALYNRANYWGEAFGLTVDWIYPILTPAEKASIRKVFMRWGEEALHAATSGQEHPQPVGVENDKRLLADRDRLRWAANNYYTAHMRHLTLMGLALDEADDPPVDPRAPAGKLGNSLRSYLGNAVGAWLYQQYAIYEQPAIAAAALGVPERSVGFASGGLSPEGFLYGASLGSLHQALLALYTAGKRDPKVLGPQIGLIDSGYWERYLDGILHSITPVPEKGRRGTFYPMMNYGDTLRLWMTPEHIPGIATLAVHARLTGQEQRLAKARWLLTAAMEGGPERVAHRAAAIWGNSQASTAILSFMALEPQAKPAEDPRPSLPTLFHDEALGRIVARSAWGAEGTVFDYKCSWSTIGHQFGDCNQIELYRKGEWLVKERSGYANDLVATTSENHNTLAIENTAANGAQKPAGLQWFEEATWKRGGQWGLGQSMGDPTVRAGFAKGWVFAEGDATNLYNRKGGYAGDTVDVVHGSRSVVWIKPDRVVLLDRATTRTDGKMKRFYLTFVGEPVADKDGVTVTTAKGQRLFVRTLLPAGASVKAEKAEPFAVLAEGEPTRFRMTVEDPKHPRDVRFLHVLEGVDAGATGAPVSMVRSSDGTPYVGAVVGEHAVLFPVDAGASFTKVVYRVPAGTTGQVVTGLAPGGGYDVSLKKVGGALEVTVAPGSGSRADKAGALGIGGLAP